MWCQIFILPPHFSVFRLSLILDWLSLPRWKEIVSHSLEMLQSPTWHSSGRSEWTLINFYFLPLSSFSSLSAACPVGYFKSVSGSVPCLVCPSNSRTSQEGSSVCECRSSFYRSANDANSSACTSELCWFVCLRQALWEAFKGPLWPFVIYSDCENGVRVTDQKSSCFSTI